MSKMKIFVLLATAATATIVLVADANARHYGRHHFYGYHGRSGSYVIPTRVYAANHYYRRPYQQSFNPDFQLGGGDRSF